mgnify:FL=1
MSVAFNSFDRSTVGAFTRSTLGARGRSNPTGNWYNGFSKFPNAVNTLIAHQTFAENDPPQSIWKKKTPLSTQAIICVHGDIALTTQSYCTPDYGVVTPFNGAANEDSVPFALTTTPQRLVSGRLIATAAYFIDGLNRLVYSDDGGINWVRIYLPRYSLSSPGAVDPYVYDGTIHVSANNRIFASASVSNAGEGFWYSDDEGNTWRKVVSYAYSQSSEFVFGQFFNKWWTAADGALWTRTGILGGYAFSMDSGTSWSAIQQERSSAISNMEPSFVVRFPSGKLIHYADGFKGGISSVTSVDNFQTVTIVSDASIPIVIMPDFRCYRFRKTSSNPNVYKIEISVDEATTWTAYAAVDINAGNLVRKGMLINGR